MDWKKSKIFNYVDKKPLLIRHQGDKKSTTIFKTLISKQ